LASIAWAHHLDMLDDFGEDAIAVQMPAQRSQIFTAIYQVPASGSGLTPLLPDAVMTLEAWQQTLQSLSTPYHLIQAPMELGTSVLSLLALAYLDWQQGKRPHWSGALPFYGQHPVES